MAALTVLLFSKWPVYICCHHWHQSKLWIEVPSEILENINTFIDTHCLFTHTHLSLRLQQRQQAGHRREPSTTIYSSAVIHLRAAVHLQRPCARCCCLFSTGNTVNASRETSKDVFPLQLLLFVDDAGFGAVGGSYLQKDRADCWCYQHEKTKTDNSWFGSQ